MLGSATFQIQDLQRAADGSPTVPQGTSGVAYHVEGTGANPVFVLSPTSQNLQVVSSIDMGSLATVTWADCTVGSYRISAHEMDSFNDSSPAAAPQGLTVYFPIDPSGAGFVFTGEFSAEQVNQPGTPTVQAAEAVPTAFVIPTADCGAPTLVLGSATYEIENFTPAADGSLNLPADSSGTAYWL